jgi:hypothetical protein
MVAERDVALLMLRDAVEAIADNVRVNLTLPGVGHWTQQEAPRRSERGPIALPRERQRRSVSRLRRLDLAMQDHRGLALVALPSSQLKEESGSENG